MNIERYREIGVPEVDGDNLFFSVIAVGKEKGIFDQASLVYIDTELSKMIGETAKLCGKGYIKQESARIMLGNIFMILGGAYDRLDIDAVLRDVREKKLYDAWKRGIEKSISAFDRTVKNIYHLEHLFYKYPEHRLGFAVKMKGEYGFSNVFTHSFERAVFTKSFFSLSGNEDYGCVCRLSEILCTMCDILSLCDFSQLYPALESRERIGYEGEVNYTMSFLSSVMVSACYAGFYRCEGLFPGKALAREVLESITGSDRDELVSDFRDFLAILIKKLSVDIVKKQDSVGENILNVYASRVCDENLSLLAEHLADFVIKKRSSEKGLRNLIIFI